jgi:hypothetical protein
MHDENAVKLTDSSPAFDVLVAERELEWLPAELPAPQPTRPSVQAARPSTLTTPNARQPSHAYPHPPRGWSAHRPEHRRGRLRRLSAPPAPCSGAAQPPPWEARAVTRRPRQHARRSSKRTIAHSSSAMRSWSTRAHSVFDLTAGCAASIERTIGSVGRSFFAHATSSLKSRTRGLCTGLAQRSSAKLARNVSRWSERSADDKTI